MSYDVSGFTDYVDRAKDFLTATLFIGGDTGKVARFMTGVKGKTSVPHIAGVAALQKGTCKDASGSTAVTEIFIEVQEWTYYEGFCEDDLQTKFPNTMLAPGSNNEGDAPKGWREKIVDVKVASIQLTLELTYWQGDTAGTYTLFDGFIKKIDAAGDAIDGNTTSATAITAANVIGLVDDMRTAAPVDVKEDAGFVILVGNDTFDLYIAAQKTANNYHYNADNSNGEYIIGGSAAKLMRIRGLNGTDRMFASVGSNFIVGSDVEGEDSIIDIWYAKEEDKVFFRTKAKSGVTIANSSEIVEFTLTV